MGALKNIAMLALGGAAGYAGSLAIDYQREVKRNAGIAKGKKLVILGAGFAGRAVAAELASVLPDPSNGEITLVDEDNFLLFTPMLTEAAGGDIDPRHIAVPVRRLPKRINFVQGSVKRIDLASKTVTVGVGSEGLDPGEIELHADHLVIALGSVTNFHHVPGVAQNSLGVKRLEDASAVCDRVLNCVERAISEQDDERRKALLTFVVAGGGYTGVETMATINDLARDRAEENGIADRTPVRAILINPGERLLEETSPELAQYAAEKLQEHGVELRMKTSITGASAGDVELNNGERIATHTLIWAAGVKPSPVISGIDCEKGKHGGIKVNSCCQVLQHAGVWGIGDCAEIPDSSSGESKTYAPTAQNATREGTLVARNIVRTLRGVAPKPFLYKPVGQLALVGKHSGVARLWSTNISGLTAWAMWRAVYLAKMPGTARKLRVASDWAMDLLLGRDAVPTGSQTAASSASAQAKAAQTS